MENLYLVTVEVDVGDEVVEVEVELHASSEEIAKKNAERKANDEIMITAVYTECITCED